MSKYSVKEAMNRYHRKRRAHEAALIEQWIGRIEKHDHVAQTVTAPADEGRNGTALDEVTESRCACGQLMGFAS